MSEKVIFAWSGGKDSAIALHEINLSGKYEVLALLTTVNEDYGRICMHGVPLELLDRQVSSIGLALDMVFIPAECSQKEYDIRMSEALKKYIAAGISSVVFGDIFLESLRKYREDRLKEAGLRGVFPLWKRDTKALAREFVASGFKAVITCVDSKVLPKTFAGREFDDLFLSDLPSGVDPCGENGEFHSFVYDGPAFKRGVPVKRNGFVLRDERFYYCDLTPEF